MALTVILTGSEENGYTSDVSAAKIYAARNQGRQIIAYYINYKLTVAVVSGSYTLFTAKIGDAIKEFRVLEDGSVIASTNLSLYASTQRLPEAQMIQARENIDAEKAAVTVTLTGSGADGYTSDIGAAEIYTARSEGRQIFGVFNGYGLNLEVCGSTFTTFTRSMDNVGKKVAYTVQKDKSVVQSVALEVVRELSDGSQVARIKAGKNILSLGPEDYLDGYDINVGNLAAISSYTASDFVEVKPSTTYTISPTPWPATASVLARAWLYDANKKKIGNATYSDENIATFITGPTTKYIRFSVRKSMVPDTSALMIEEGNVATEFEPYRVHMSAKTEELAFGNGILGDYLDTGKRVTVGTDSISITDGGFTWVFQKKGPNSIMDLKTVSLDSEVVITPPSDWMGPYRVDAVNNPDGDSSGAAYTGGNHGYLNTGALTVENSPTGRTVSFAAYVDNETVGDTSSFSDSVRMQWINRIQGRNTKKVDGSGREVLEETIEMTYLGHGLFEVSNHVQAMEAVTITEYHGMQITNGWRIRGLTSRRCPGSMSHTTPTLQSRRISGSVKWKWHPAS